MKRIFIFALVLIACAGGAEAGDCVATFNRDVSPNMFNQNSKWEPVPYYRAGMSFKITGGIPNPSMVCQHRGDCVPRLALNFPSKCVLIGGKQSYGTYYYGWELH